MKGFRKNIMKKGLDVCCRIHEIEPSIGLKEYNKSGQERKSKAAFVFGEKIPLMDCKNRGKTNNKVKEVSIFQGSLKKDKFMHQGLLKLTNLQYGLCYYSERRNRSFCCHEI